VVVVRSAGRGLHTPPTLAALKRGVTKVTARYGTLTATVTVAVTDP
jgi:hypothetical protein